eukprot:1187633-Rhodomonas_salina.2
MTHRETGPWDRHGALRNQMKSAAFLVHTVLRLRVRVFDLAVHLDDRALPCTDAVLQVAREITY